jgi:hypothetical protein
MCYHADSCYTESRIFIVILSGVILSGIILGVVVPLIDNIILWVMEYNYRRKKFYKCSINYSRKTFFLYITQGPMLKAFYSHKKNALPTNIRLRWKDMLGTNTLAFYKIRKLRP